MRWERSLAERHRGRAAQAEQAAAATHRAAADGQAGGREGGQGASRWAWEEARSQGQEGRCPGQGGFRGHTIDAEAGTEPGRRCLAQAVVARPGAAVTLGGPHVTGMERFCEGGWGAGGKGGVWGRGWEWGGAAAQRGRPGGPGAAGKEGRRGDEGRGSAGDGCAGLKEGGQRRQSQQWRQGGR